MSEATDRLKVVFKKAKKAKKAPLSNISKKFTKAELKKNREILKKKFPHLIKR